MCARPRPGTALEVQSWALPRAPSVLQPVSRQGGRLGQLWPPSAGLWLKLCEEQRSLPGDLSGREAGGPVSVVCEGWGHSRELEHGGGLQKLGTRGWE